MQRNSTEHQEEKSSEQHLRKTIEDQLEPSKRLKLDNNTQTHQQQQPSTDNHHPDHAQTTQPPLDRKVEGSTREQSEGEDSPSEALELTFSWRDSNFNVALDGMVTIKDLKVVIYSVTAVPPERQKILGLVLGQIPADDVLLSTLQFKIKKGVHFKLLGTPEDESLSNTRPEGSSSSTLDQSDSHSIRKARQSHDCVLYMKRVRDKLDQISNTLELNIMNPPRQGKKLLVLDLDYTLMDSKAYSDYSVHALDMARPYLHEFLTCLWPYYDICIWSATSWRWLESKLVELGMVGGNHSDKYLIQFVLDRGTMFEVTSMRHGKISKHEVKALELIWRKIPTYNETNTVHLDDLSRNFALNPRSGVKLSAFKNARANKHDRQLVFLARYFLQIASLPDVRMVDHKKWADCSLPLPFGTPDPLEILDPADPELVKFRSSHAHLQPPS
ncbi:hypothetical protein PCANC_01678 [Puccinia coronata f. sp. avenae]|uniref:FCP1 homology domain-containing protein n=1 Tax=Puccinia coronata f. sp. avenae TaxID=200324 RepID=A0A2N5VQU9_9BASI|nr:hypothetical protein PCASD_00236 [Puccinia coronata f. sp. avenae]PLW56778.1 hypothetical protein PCANC_01678 [Puccinia coronata f. sp. avenae]